MRINNNLPAMNSQSNIHINKSINKLKEKVDPAFALNQSAGNASDSAITETIKGQMVGVSKENQIAAESRIQDIEKAAEIFEAIKSNILQQANMAILVQSNRQPQQVLKLLNQ